MSVSAQKKRKSRRLCGHCDNELCHSAYFEHKTRYFINGVWERKFKRAKSDPVKEPLSSSVHTGRAEELHPSDKDETADDQSLHAVGESDAVDEALPPSDPSSDNDDRSIHLFLDSSESNSEEDDEANISCDVDKTVTEEDEEGKTLAEEQSEVCPSLQEGEGDGSAQSLDKLKLLSAISGLSRQVAQLEQKLDQCLAAAEVREQRFQDRIAAMEAKLYSFSSGEQIKRKRRVHCPKIAETVRRLHNSEENIMRYKPEQGLGSPRNEAVTTYLVKTLAASPDLKHVETDALLSACKTYYETLRRNFRYKQPDLAAQAEAVKSSARSRQRRKRLLDARKTVLAPDEEDLWRGITIDMMSDEEDGNIDKVSGWIVRPPSFRSQELDNLCAALQARLEADVKYTLSHRRRLQIGQPSDRMPPNKYDPEAAKRHFKPDLMPKPLASSWQ